MTAADSLTFSAGKFSRYTKRRLKLPRVNQDPGRYLETLVKELRSQPYDLLLPTFEESLLLSEYESELRPYTRLLLPDFSSMYSLHHKPSLHKLCQSLDLPTPPTLVPKNSDQLPMISDQLGFPVVVKLPGGNNSVGRSFCNNSDELKRTFEQQAALHAKDGSGQPFVQKKIEGDLICTLSFCSQGHKLGEVVYRTLRMFPEAGGTSAHRQSIEHPEISRISKRLIAASGWSGFLGLDFLLERETGIPYVIDANVRANPAIHLGFCSGLDWTQLIFDIAKDKTPAVQTARTGVSVHTVLMDVVWLLEGLHPRTGGIRRFPQRLREFITPPWPVHSRGDLVATGEVASSVILGLESLVTGIQSLVTGRQAGELMLEHANYDSHVAEQYRQQRQDTNRDRVAA